MINSISQLRLSMFDLYQNMPFSAILLVSERSENGRGVANHAAGETYATACEMLAAAKDAGLSDDQVIIDPAIAPLGSDSEGNIHRLMGALRLIHEDPIFANVHISVGLSNFTVMLPTKRADGLPVKSSLESAFLTRAMPLGLDTVIGSVKRKYQMLPEGHDALVCFDDVLKLEGFDVLMRVQEFYAG